jgi:hypothetical protein
VRAGRGGGGDRPVRGLLQNGRHAVHLRVSTGSVISQHLDQNIELGLTTAQAKAETPPERSEFNQGWTNPRGLPGGLQREPICAGLY